ncbi:hypothetical protein BJX61DRAFT_504613 [Aspergillus egyptiacus]|nr:hypothetical protein BJX61DRAFT_504613 [Aspergillus egyptiacus]
MQPNHRPSPHEYSSSFSSSETGSPGPTIKYEEGGYDRKPRTIERRPAPASEMESLRRELEDSRQRIDRDTDVINSLHEKVTKLEELVEKQRMTIATQSKTISDRRGLRKHQQQQQQQQQQQSPMRMFPMTPSHHHHHVPQYHYPVSGSGSGAPTVSGPGSSAAAAAGVYAIQHPSSPLENQIQGQAQTPQSATSLASTAQSGGTVFDQPPPKFEIPIPLCTSYSAYTGVVPSGLAHCSVADLGGSNLSTAKDVFTPLCLSANNGTAPTSSKPLYSCSADYHKEMGDFSTRFLALMRMSEIFGQTHASLPNIFMDSHLDDKVKNYLMVISSRGQASVLVGNSATRGFFVAKAINWYLIDKILKVTVISGFNASVDREISLIQKQMTSGKYSSKPPPTSTLTLILY